MMRYIYHSILSLCVISAAVVQTSAQTTVSERFKQRDKNGDGKLSQVEFPAAVFDRLDADKDGFVTSEELGRIRKPAN